MWLAPSGPLGKLDEMMQAQLQPNDAYSSSTIGGIIGGVSVGKRTL